MVSYRKSEGFPEIPGRSPHNADPCHLVTPRCKGLRTLSRLAGHKTGLLISREEGTLVIESASSSVCHTQGTKSRDF